LTRINWRVPTNTPGPILANVPEKINKKKEKGKANDVEVADSQSNN
jgi:hypothetical protein